MASAEDREEKRIPSPRKKPKAAAPTPSPTSRGAQPIRRRRRGEGSPERTIRRSPQPAALQRIRERIEDYLVDDRTPTRPPEARLDAEQLRSLSGRYQALTWRLPAGDQGAVERGQLEVEVSGTRLIAHTPDGRKHRLLAVSPHLFRRPEQPLASVAFFEYGSDVYLLGALGNYLRLAAPAGGVAASQR